MYEMEAGDREKDYSVRYLLSAFPKTAHIISILPIFNIQGDFSWVENDDRDARLTTPTLQLNDYEDDTNESSNSIVSERKKQFRFRACHNVSLLKSVHARDPFHAAKGEVMLRWKEVSNDLHVDGIEVDDRRCQQHFRLLLDKFKREDNAELYKSGSAEDYDEMKRLLTEIRALVEDSITTTAAATSVSARERKAALDRRDIGLAVLAHTGGQLAAEAADNQGPSIGRDVLAIGPPTKRGSASEAIEREEVVRMEYMEAVTAYLRHRIARMENAHSADRPRADHENKYGLREL